MKRGILICCVLLCALVWIVPCHAQWEFYAVDTARPDPWGVEGRLLMPDGATLVPEGCLVQFVLDTAGDGLDDPLEFFDADASGHIDTESEAAALKGWINGGADPSAFSDDQLLTAADWDGTSVIGQDWQVNTAGPGEVLVFPDNPYRILNGNTGDAFGWRVWSVSPVEMAGWAGNWGEQLWYTTGREQGTYLPNGLPYDGWWVGAPDGAEPENWFFTGTIGLEVWVSGYTGDPQYRTENRLDHDLTYIPEPATLALVGLGFALLLRRFGRRAP